ncbi:hypothetical protein RUND412_010034, partial [Rhizina undulata]
KVMDIDQELAELYQGEGEELDSYYVRARRMLVGICNDLVMNRVVQKMTKAKTQWVKMVMNKFVEGLLNKWVEYYVSNTKQMSLEGIFKAALEMQRRFN